MTIKVSNKVLAIVLSCMGVISAEAMHRCVGLMGFNTYAHHQYPAGDESQGDEVRCEVCSKVAGHDVETAEPVGFGCCSASEIEEKHIEFEACSKAAERGDPKAQFNMGMAYQLGLIVPSDLEKAESLYLKAVAQNYAPAQCELGRMYLHVQEDFEKAYGLFLMAAKQGYLLAMHMLGIMYEHGLYVEQDQELARELYEASGR